jgi:hypothetical protein
MVLSVRFFLHQNGPKGSGDSRSFLPTRISAIWETGGCSAKTIWSLQILKKSGLKSPDRVAEQALILTMSRNDPTAADRMFDLVNR